MIAKEFIEQLLMSVDIIDVIERHVPLKKRGANFMACCPFHKEKTPSFSVNQSKQFYYCFGCGARGNAIQFLMNHLGLSFVEAVEMLAHSVGLSVPKTTSHAPQPQTPQHERAQLNDYLHQAARFYKSQLKQTPNATHYLKQRGISGQTAQRFFLGYAPNDFQALAQFFPATAIPELITVGLMKENEHGKIFDRFRDRIMFPIRNLRGQFVGFGGRVIDAGEPKYLNSPETPLFLKAKELYGLFEARAAIRAHNRVLVVEGYMDVVMLSEHGIDYAVATLGTATSTTHISVLMRQAEHIFFCFDGDAAGEKAAWRALELALEKIDDHHQIHFVFLPKHHDPDSFVRELGKEAFERYLQEHAESLAHYFLKKMTARNEPFEGQSSPAMRTPEHQAKLLADAKPLLEKLKAPALSLVLRTKIAQLLNMNLQDLERELFGKTKPFRRNKMPSPTHYAPVLTIYERLMRTLLFFPEFAKLVHFEQLPDTPELEAFKTLTRQIIEQNLKHTAQIFDVLAHASTKKDLSPLLQSTLSTPITERSEPAALRAEFQDILSALAQQKRHQRLDLLKQKAQRHALNEQEKQEMLALISAHSSF